jgi:hypothetical protein
VKCICACPTAFFDGRPRSQVIDKHLPATSLITALEVPLHQENLDLDLEPPFDQPRNVAYRGIFRSKVSDSVNCNTKKKNFTACMHAQLLVAAAPIYRLSSGLQIGALNWLPKAIYSAAG